MFIYSFILISFLLPIFPIFPIHSFFIHSKLGNLLIGHKKEELKDRFIIFSKQSGNSYISNQTFQKIHNITELQIHLNKTLALPVRWNDGEVPW